jgi:hypothetical protein
MLSLPPKTSVGAEWGQLFRGLGEQRRDHIMGDTSRVPRLALGRLFAELGAGLHQASHLADLILRDDAVGLGPRRRRTIKGRQARLERPI